MLDQYWNSASLLRASLISAGIPEDVAALVTAKTRDNSQVISTFFLAALPSAGAGLVVAWILFPLSGYLYSLASISPSFAALYVPQLVAITTIMVVNLWVVRVWDELRYLIFIRIALNQVTLGIGILNRAAIRRASGLHGAEYVRKAVSLPLRIVVWISAGATAVVLCLSLL